jgi:thiamine pyrophosphokinase
VYKIPSPVSEEGFLMRAVIFANGVLTKPEKARSVLRSGDLIIAADGGARHCSSLGIKPDIVIGDFDSLDPDEMSALEAAGARLVRYPIRKDFTDLELAIQFANEKDAEEVLVLGALGSRWDQTLANLLLPAARAYSIMHIRILDGSQEISLIQADQTLSLSGQPGDIVSLLPLGGNVQGVTTKGLEYPLVYETLYFGATRGISNVMLDRQAEIKLKSGLLLCILIHKE